MYEFVEEAVVEPTSFCFHWPDEQDPRRVLFRHCWPYCRLLPIVLELLKKTDPLAQEKHDDGENQVGD